jgi:hypothetical protein
MTALAIRAIITLDKPDVTDNLLVKTAYAMADQVAFLEAQVDALRDENVALEERHGRALEYAALLESQIFDLTQERKDILEQAEFFENRLAQYER